MLKSRSAEPSCLQRNRGDPQRTTAYRHHPQLNRFRQCAAPRSAINGYLALVHQEAEARGYHFDRSKLARIASAPRMLVTDGQLRYEWSWLLDKLRRRSPAVYRLHRTVCLPAAHPSFAIVPGPVEAWERAPQPPASKSTSSGRPR